MFGCHPFSIWEQHSHKQNHSFVSNAVSRPRLTVCQKWNYPPAAVCSEHQQVENDPDLLNCLGFLSYGIQLLEHVYPQDDRWDSALSPDWWLSKHLELFIVRVKSRGIYKSARPWGGSELVSAWRQPVCYGEELLNKSVKVHLEKKRKYLRLKPWGHGSQVCCECATPEPFSTLALFHWEILLPFPCETLNKVIAGSSLHKRVNTKLLS